MRTTLTLDDDLYRAARTLAEHTGQSLGAVVSQLVRRGLKPRAPRRRGADDLPVFDVPDDEPIIPGLRAAKLLAEEGAD